MDFYFFKKKRLKGWNRFINIFLVLLMGISLTLLIFLGLSEAGLKHFEDRADPICDKIVVFISDNAKEVIKEEVNQQADSLKEDALAEIPEGDLCTQIDFNEIPDEELRQQAIDLCAQGPITKDDIPTEMLEQGTDAFIDSQVETYVADYEGTIRSEYTNQVGQRREWLENLKSRFWFLDMARLNMLFAVLLLIYLLNNGLVITVNYLAKKLIFLVPLVFILPYILFKLNFLKLLVDAMGLTQRIQADIPIDAGQIVNGALKLVSDELVLFYGQMLSWSILAFFAGLLLYFGNKYMLMPHFAKKRGIVEEEKPIIRPQLPVHEPPAPVKAPENKKPAAKGKKK